MRMDHVEGPLHILLVEIKGQPYLTCYTSLFSLFSLSFVFYIGEEGKKSMMDHLGRRGRILVALSITIKSKRLSTTIHIQAGNAIM